MRHDNILGWFNISGLTCKTKRDAQASVAMIRRMEPMSQSLSEGVVEAFVVALLFWL